MANMIVVYRIMPKDGEVKYSKLENASKKVITSYDKGLIIKEINSHDVGFGLKACKVKFQLNEDLGSETLENNLKELDEVGDVVIELMDRL